MTWGRRSRAIALAALVTMLVSAAVAIAAPAPLHSGTVGPHWLRDSDEYPMVNCVYDEFGFLDVFRIRAPIVQAARAASQQVGWRYRIEWSNDGNTWALLTQSSFQKQTATGEHPAHLSVRRYTFASVQHDYYRVRIRMAWYDGSAIDGWADHWAHWYRQILPTAQPVVVTDRCAGVLT